LPFAAEAGSVEGNAKSAIAVPLAASREKSLTLFIICLLSG
jgi:hypothetical protein